MVLTIKLSRTVEIWDVTQGEKWKIEHYSGRQETTKGVLTSMRSPTMVIRPSSTSFSVVFWAIRDMWKSWSPDTPYIWTWQRITPILLIEMLNHNKQDHLFVYLPVLVHITSSFSSRLSLFFYGHLLRFWAQTVLDGWDWMDGHLMSSVF